MSNTTKMFSIIIPCYNCEKTIVKALNSIETNKTNDYEIIIVDDCSTDKTIGVIENFINDNRYEEIVLLKNDFNVGAGITRNRALQHSRGKYILFLDADDELIDGALDYLYKCAQKNYDVILFDAYTKSNKKIYMLSSKQNNVNDIDKNDAFVYSRGCVWGKLFKRSIIIGNEIKFGDLKIAEDFVFTKRALLKCNTIYYLHKPLYVYDDGNKASLMHRYVREDDNYELRSFEMLRNYEYKEELNKEFNSIYFLEVIYGYNSRVMFSKTNYLKKRDIFNKLSTNYITKDPYYRNYVIKYKIAHKLLKLLYLYK